MPFTAEFSFEQQWIDSLDEEQQWQALQKALDALAPRQREALYLRFFNDLDYAQIAGVMNLNYQATRNQVYLALKAIREQFPVNWQLIRVKLSTSRWAAAITKIAGRLARPVLRNLNSYLFLSHQRGVLALSAPLSRLTAAFTASPLVCFSKSRKGMRRIYVPTGRSALSELTMGYSLG